MNFEGVVLDLDGTVYRGGEPTPGAPEVIGRLRERGCQLLFCSNNPTKGRAAYVDRLAGMGIEATVDEVLSAGTVTTQYLREHHGEDLLYVIGSSGLREQFADADLRTTNDPEAGEVLVVSFYRGFDYDTLTEAYYAGRDGVPFVGSDPDVVIPTEEGMVPGSGAIIGAVAGILERDPDHVLGKPSPEAVEMATDALGVPPNRCLMVGDRLDTDIAFGERAGMTTALVRTGVNDDADVAESDVTPDHVLDSIADVERLFD
ncbi:HAD-IIA family hydrolase [Haloglomus litoreum]|uniref:HAD-IIA family hydrolase n=1 Tax=Haloglomus litoreum TaxID=3034026 RepID=UPI0023E83709|nr:HAD-IIA family hydrolase [Haloglomus sp. DT116]